jgi:hypothetical protein
MTNPPSLCFAGVVAVGTFSLLTPSLLLNGPVSIKRYSINGQLGLYGAGKLWNIVNVFTDISEED